jgi:sirohydrochlorin cobaltochelatase
MQPKENLFSILLLAHGSKDPEWKRHFLMLKSEIKGMCNHSEVFLSFFELEYPTLEQLIEQLIKKGKRKFFIYPILLANGFHLKKDLPDRIESIKKKYANLEIKCGTSLIEQPLIRKSIAETILKVSNQ